MYNLPEILHFEMTANKIDFRTMPRNVPSLCIPRVFSNIDERRICRVFEELDMGEIERVDIVKKTTEKGEKYNRVFIHWKSWNSSENANQARERLLNGKEIKIIYDEPWFWKISAYREPVARQTNRPPPANRSAPRISFDCDEDRQRPSNPRQRQDEDRRSSNARSYKPRLRQEYRQRPRQQPTTPDCSPPRIREDENEERDDVMRMSSTAEPIKLDYGNLPMPVKKLNFKKKPNLVEEKKTIIVEEEV
jgi:hypothetical protein